MTYEAQHDSENLWYVAQKNDDGEIIKVTKVFCNAEKNTAEDAISLAQPPDKELT